MSAGDALPPEVGAEAGTPDAWAAAIESQMTDDERFALLISVMGATEAVNPVRDRRIPDGVPMSAGYTPGVPRLGVPALLMTDAGLGVTNPGYRPGDGATALPATLALAASFDPALARAAGQVVGREARARRFNVVLGGGMNLVRDPRNGRNFEYLSEDPWLSAVMAAATVNGIQGEHVISTVKHYSLNCNETNRHWLNAVIDPAAHRESDLLAFQIAIERSQPGAVMAAYNQVNGEYAGGNRHLLQEVLKTAWGYRGWVMSDWGATPSWRFALAGLDQESGVQMDVRLWQAQPDAEPFVGPLRRALADGELPRARLSDMVRRILRSIHAVAVDQATAARPADMRQHRQVALEIARQGIVLLKNDGVLPLAPRAGMRVAVIGGFAHVGVPVGAGSSAVVPPGGYAASIPVGGPGAMGKGRKLSLLPSSPLDELARLLPDAVLEFDPGMVPAEAARLAARCDLAVVFGVRLEGEGFDLPDLSLPWGQDATIDAVAAANPHTVVVLQTGNPVAMPWHDRAAAIVEAWYPGLAGGQAIAEVLTGAVNPSGRLPITFPADLAQTPRPVLAGLGTPWGTRTTISYHEGAEVGYRWFAHTGRAPRYAFGHGLSYTRFSYADLEVRGGDTIAASFTVTNSGDRSGADVPQLYLISAADGARMRLLGFERVALAPRQSRRVTVTADARLLARFDAAAQRWRIADGVCQVALGRSAGELVLRAEARVTGRLFGR